MYFAKEEFEKINLQVSEQVLLLPQSTNLRCQLFKFWSFQSYTYTKFIAAFEELIIHYGKKKEHTFNGITNTQNPDINENKTCVEWQGFKHFMYLKHDAHCHKIEIEMQSYKEDEKAKKETLKTHTHKKKWTAQFT